MVIEGGVPVFQGAIGPLINVPAIVGDTSSGLCRASSPQSLRKVNVVHRIGGEGCQAAWDTDRMYRRSACDRGECLAGPPVAEGRQRRAGFADDVVVEVVFEAA